MAVTRTEWNAIVIGHWNRAILTPAWIGKHLFGLEPGTPVEVRVPLDDYRPYEVTHDGVTVLASSSHLFVRPVAKDFAALGKAAAIAAKTVTELPRTPLLAAGLNCNFKSDAPLERLSEVTNHSTDSSLVDAGYRITGRSTRRSIKWNDGSINLSVDDDEEDGRTIHFNFHLADKENEQRLAEWLKQPIAEVEKAVAAILEKYLNINLEETCDGK